MHSARIQFSLRSAIVFAASSFVLVVVDKAMRLTKFIVVVLFLVAKMCGANSVIATPNPEESTSSLIKDLVNVLTSCYRNQINGIGVAGNFSGALLRSLSTQQLIPVTLFDDPSNATKKPRRVPVRFRRKLQFFIVEQPASFEQLHHIIEKNIKYSIWWNHMASFIILDDSLDCNNAAGYLLVAWYSDILNAKVICYGNNGRTNIVSYNPFTSVAPASWHWVDAGPGIDEHPFNVFSREYTGDESICVDLDYEKTNDLGGYGIRVQGPPLGNIVYDKINVNTYRFISTHERILHTIYRAMNSTPMFSGRFTHELPTYKDMAKNSRSMIFTWENVLITYPHEQTGLVLITQFRGHKSQLAKILSIIDIYSSYGLVIVYSVSLIFFKFFVGQDLMPALLNLTRITSGTGFTNLPVNTASRVYLTSLLFFALTILGIYQGSLASLLTTKIPLRNVDTVKDLVNFRYNVFGLRDSKYMIELPNVEKRYMVTDNVYDCINHVRHDSSAACIWFAQASALDGARLFKLHVSSHFVVPTYIGFAIRWNWALEERVNTILAKMVEADILQSWDIKCNPTKLSDFLFDEEVKKNTTHKVLELRELLFAFVFLSIGLACATIIFIIELAIHRFQIRIVSNVTVQIFN